MKIHSLKTFIVRNPPPFNGGRYFIFLKLVTDDGIEVTPDANRQYDYKVYVGGMYQYWSCTRDVLQPKPDGLNLESDAVQTQLYRELDALRLELADRIRPGTSLSLAAWNNWIDDLALGLTNVIAFVNPEVIAMGGGVSSAGDFMLDAVRALVDARTTTVPKGSTKIIRAVLGNDAGAVGAATMAMRGGLLATLAPLAGVAAPAAV